MLFPKDYEKYKQFFACIKISKNITKQKHSIYLVVKFVKHTYRSYYISKKEYVKKKYFKLLVQWFEAYFVHTNAQVTTSFTLLYKEI